MNKGGGLWALLGMQKLPHVVLGSSGQEFSIFYSDKTQPTSVSQIPFLKGKWDFCSDVMVPSANNPKGGFARICLWVLWGFVDRFKDNSFLSQGPLFEENAKAVTKTKGLCSPCPSKDFSYGGFWRPCHQILTVIWG